MLIDRNLKKFINGIPDYEIYWFAIEMNQITATNINILSTPEHIRSEIINRLEFKKFSIDKADQILRHVKEYRVIPINTVNWFYKKNKETLLLYMFFHYTKETITEINIESKIDIELFTVELIYSNMLSRDYKQGEIAREFAKTRLKNLKEIYNKSKTSPTSLNWLEKNNTDQIKWAYNYKARARKYEKSLYAGSILMFPSLFNIDPDDTNLMYDHIVASLDFSVFIIFFDGDKTLHPDNEIIQKLKDERLNFIHKMRNAWHKKVSQEKRKNTTTRFRLSSEALAQLKELAKKERISQDKLLENIITEYYNDNKFKGTL